MRWLGGLVILAALAVASAVSGCGDDAETAAQRGAPKLAGGGKEDKAEKAETQKPSGRGPKPAAPAEAPPEAVPDHPRRVLTREDFATETRDPFQRFVGGEAVETQVAPRDVERQREVRLPEYNFEDLKLIGIVMSGRGIQPRALFLATDGKSKSVKQGEYFSRAEVLLAAVNRDYVEIEVVDETLAKGLNMAAGERRAIYLKKD
jgi:Tfp pilus assembly protein PilP